MMIASVAVPVMWHRYTELHERQEFGSTLTRGSTRTGQVLLAG